MITISEDREEGGKICGIIWSLYEGCHMIVFILQQIGERSESVIRFVSKILSINCGYECECVSEWVRREWELWECVKRRGERGRERVRACKICVSVCKPARLVSGSGERLCLLACACVTNRCRLVNEILKGMTYYNSIPLRASKE